MCYNLTITQDITFCSSLFGGNRHATKLQSSQLKIWLNNEFVILDALWVYIGRLHAFAQGLGKCLACVGESCFAGLFQCEDEG